MNWNNNLGKERTGDATAGVARGTLTGGTVAGGTDVAQRANVFAAAGSVAVEAVDAYAGE